MTAGLSEEDIWVELAEFFFLDTEPTSREKEKMIANLKQAGWSAEKTRKVLTEIVAPVAGANLGFLIWPVMGEWAGFDKEMLIQRMRQASAKRSRLPAWNFMVMDWLCKRMLKQLEVESFLKDLS